MRHRRPYGLAHVLASTTADHLPAAVLAHAHRAVLDWLGSALAGAHRAAGADGAARGGGPRGLRRGDGVRRRACVGGRGGVRQRRRVAHPRARRHSQGIHRARRRRRSSRRRWLWPSASTRTGRAFLPAVALGYEAAFRIGEAVNPSHYRFWHPTGTAATFGAAAAAGSLLRLDADADAARARHRRHAGRGPVGVQRRRRDEQAPASGQGGDEWRPVGGSRARRLHRRAAASSKASADSSAR